MIFYHEGHEEHEGPRGNDLKLTQRRKGAKVFKFAEYGLSDFASLREKLRLISFVLFVSFVVKNCVLTCLKT